MELQAINADGPDPADVDGASSESPPVASGSGSQTRAAAVSTEEVQALLLEGQTGTTIHATTTIVHDAITLIDRLEAPAPSTTGAKRKRPRKAKNTGTVLAVEVQPSAEAQGSSARRHKRWKDSV